MNMPGVGRCGVVGTEKFMMCGGDGVDGRGGLGVSELQMVVGDTRWRLGVDINRAQMLKFSRRKETVPRFESNGVLEGNCGWTVCST